MVLIFTQTTTCLSPEFVNSFSAENLALYLFKVAKETGVEFNRRNRTFTIIGHWNSIIAAHKTLESILIEKSQSLENDENEQLVEISCELRGLRKNASESDGHPRGRKPGYTLQPVEYSVPDPLVYIKFQAQDKEITQKPNKLVKNDTIIVPGDVGIVSDLDLQNQLVDASSKNQNIHSKHVDLTSKPNDIISEKNDISSKQSEERQTLRDTVTVEEPGEISTESTTTNNSIEATETQPAQDSMKLETAWIKQENEVENEDNMDEDTDIDEQFIVDGDLNSTEEGSMSGSVNTNKAETKLSETTIHTNNNVEKEELDGSRTRIKSRGKKDTTVKTGEFKCELCPYVGKKRSNLKSHRKIHRKKFTCEVCDKKFRANRDLKKHVSVHENGRKPRGRKPRLNQAELKQTEKKEMNEEKTEYKCDICPYIGYKKDNLKDHMKRKHRNKYTCDVCDKKFGFNKDLRRHKTQVHCEPKYFCDKCHRVYKTKRRLDQHLKTHEADYVKPNFDCKICKKSFSTKYVLAGHIKSEHLGMKKTYLCPTCGRSFTQRNSYVMHANVHAGIKPYVCDTCGKSFTYEKSLKEHKYMHDQVRRFQCHVCAKSFRQSTCLRIHMKIHQEIKDYICKCCGKGFAQKNALMRHERIHSGVKPFVCSMCKKAYSDISILRRHLILIHKIDAKKWREAVISNIKRDDAYFIRTVDQTDKAETSSQEQEMLPNVTEVESVQSSNVSDETDHSMSNVAIQAKQNMHPVTSSAANFMPVTNHMPVSISPHIQQQSVHMSQALNTTQHLNTTQPFLTIQPLNTTIRRQTTECNPSPSDHFSNVTVRNSEGTQPNADSSSTVRWSYPGFSEYASWNHYTSSH